MSRLPSLVAAVALLASACSGTSQAVAPDGFVAGDGSTSTIPKEQREPAPDVTAPTLSGETLRLADLSGPVVVNFWASWCGPCVTEAPALQRVADEYDGRVTFVGVNVKDEPAAARNFERDFGVRYPSWHDQASSIAASFGGIGPAALPSTIVLDSDHRVASRLFGAVDEPRLAAELDRILEEDSG
ncbi:MAG: redoxin domain-containing protein [Nitriliruptorales bacterium]|nr:redoxin domain-containing protein [Nitriliruptorales bacterium]